MIKGTSTISAASLAAFTRHSLFPLSFSVRPSVRPSLSLSHLCGEQIQGETHASLNQSGMGFLFELKSLFSKRKTIQLSFSLPSGPPGILQAASMQPQRIKPSLSKRVSKHCPSSVQAPRNLSKRIFHFQKTPINYCGAGQAKRPRVTPL